MITGKTIALTRWTFSTSQRKTCTKKSSWSPFGGLLAVWSPIAFWIPLKPLHLRIILIISMICTENCNACSWHWSTERAQFFFMETPNCMSHKELFKSWMNWATKFCLHIHLTSHQPFFKHLHNFLWKNACTNIKTQKMHSNHSSNLKAFVDFHATGINKLCKILQEMGIPDQLTCFLRNLCAGQEATGHGTMDWFQIGKEAHQGCILSL